MQLFFLELAVPRGLPETNNQPKRAAPQSQESVCDLSFLLLNSLVLPSGRDDVDNIS